MSIRVLIVDDQEMVRQRLAALLGAQPDIEVVGHAPDGLAGAAAARVLRDRAQAVVTAYESGLVRPGD